MSDRKMNERGGVIFINSSRSASVAGDTERCGHLPPVVGAEQPQLLLRVGPRAVQRQQCLAHLGRPSLNPS
jgi:hypothetical protein